ncbi:hypothetical protein [Aestuariicoccus sp. MJ-SS9]|uniref:DUF7933 domain-containing protein n=1 Tax=Aestuariicoccus sp. MJ-SS9 TaxID=3079855 RepID=UPI00290F0F83|nr:hypothetical protein [Aestuariicoccus sp. MJ-SS9]MDU8910051.1 hypothetical protein [Aestuariicoccus sp. MJ-SS9]
MTTLTFTVDNASALVAATDLAFADTFPEGMTVAATPNVATTCAEANVEAAAGDGAAINNDASDETMGWRARAEAGVAITNRHGTRLELGANYDGIGRSDYESWGATFKLTIPLQ